MSRESALAAVVEGAHLVTGDGLCDLLADAVRPLGLRARLLVVDREQQTMRPIAPSSAPGAVDDEVAVEGTLAGRVYQYGRIESGGVDGRRQLVVPMFDGTERVGVLVLTLDPGTVDDPDFRSWCATLSGLLAHVVMTKLAYSDHLQRLRAPGEPTVAAQMLWELVPPRTFATSDLVVSALLEPANSVAGDAYDYAVDSDAVDLAVYDGVGHDLTAGIATRLAMTAARHARRDGRDDLAAVAAAADDLLHVEVDPAHRFVTAVLARLDREHGYLDHLVAGHPRPLLIRDGTIVRELGGPVQPPLGVAPPGGRGPATRERLEPGDRVLFYSDGITEARRPDGALMGREPLAELAERFEADRLSAPETLRRLGASLMQHPTARPSDDVTLLLLEWSTDGARRIFPAEDAGAPSPESVAMRDRSPRVHRVRRIR